MRKKIRARAARRVAAQVPQGCNVNITNQYAPDKWYLRSYRIYAVSYDGDPVYIRNTGAYTADTAHRLGARYIKQLTKVQRACLRITSGAIVIVEEDTLR